MIAERSSFAGHPSLQAVISGREVGPDGAMQAALGPSMSAMTDLTASLGAPLWIGRSTRPCVRREEALPHSSGDRASSEPDSLRRTGASPAAVPIAGRSNQA